MASPELTKELDPPESSNAPLGVSKTDSDTSDSNVAGNQSAKQVHVISPASAAGRPASEPLPDFDCAVDDAMWLLMYAAETGRNVDDTTRNSILHARAVSSAGRDETVTANLLAALTKLAAALSPLRLPA